VASNQETIMFIYKRSVLSVLGGLAIAFLPLLLGL
jgi:hypothetical protein